MADAAKKSSLPKGRHKSQIKRERQNKKRKSRNLAMKSALKKAITKVKRAVAEKKADVAKGLLREASKVIQKAAGRHLIHKKNASRKISRLSSLIQSIA